MANYIKVIKLLWKSIFTTDILIFFTAVATLVLYLLTRAACRDSKKEPKNWGKRKNIDFASYLYKRLKGLYTVFVALISLFPLLGMLGTVMGLLGLNIENGDISNIKTNFFMALTSTAWGIIFSVIFKILQASIATRVEDEIEVIHKRAEDVAKEAQESEA